MPDLQPRGAWCAVAAARWAVADTTVQAFTTSASVQSGPCYRTIFAVDIQSSTSRTDTAKGLVRSAMYDLIEQAFEDAGISAKYLDEPVDRGDGALILVHPADRAPKTTMLNAVVPILSTLLAEHCAQRPEHGFRMRAAMHAGEVNYDRRGPFGESIDLACRLLDARALKEHLLEVTAPLALVVSDYIYRTVVRHQYPGIDERAYARLVQVQLADLQHHGWVHVPPVINVFPRREVEVDFEQPLRHNGRTA